MSNAIETATSLRAVDASDNTVLDLDLIQGLWTVEQYLAFSDFSSRMIEFTDGQIELLPMPTEKHQAMLEWLFFILRDIVNARGGKARFAPLRLQVRPGKYREPDILVLLDAADPRRQNRFWFGADLVVEIVSPDNPARDITVKRADYAEIGIAEYWIVNPQDQTITVLALDQAHYREHGVFVSGQVATSLLLADFAVAVDAVMTAN
ncbi:MAG: Uma2 family endonuclease [Roseiflexaceae bacterium]|nr:Uma2 family endonuclease [Roseiflexaceae bacterium]